MAQSDIQTIIIQNLLFNETFCRKALPHLKNTYFEGVHKSLFELVLDFMVKFNKIPNQSALMVEFQKSSYINRGDAQELFELIENLNEDYETQDEKWLIKTAEEWSKSRALHIAIFESIDIIDGKKKDVAEGIIPELLTNALSVSFDVNIGHDYIENSDNRFQIYASKEDHIPFNLEKLNEITNGGVVKKTLNALMAGPGVGKSLVMCHLASDYLMKGMNVLYITMEMSEIKIAQRIDANLMDVDISMIDALPKIAFQTKAEKIKSKTKGKLIIKEYPTSCAHSGHFRALLNELKMKKKFVPDIIFVDYLNICASSRIKSMGGSANTYTYVKAIAEELRGLAVEFDVPIWTATQVNREGFGNSDVDMTNTSESFGLPATLDLFLALISTEQLERLCQLMVKQLKNRYNDLNKNNKFYLGIDKSKMRLYDVEPNSSEINTDSQQHSKTNKYQGFTV